LNPVYPAKLKEKAMYEKRIFVGWNNGTYITSVCSNFQYELEKLIEQHGKPDTVEYREEF